MKKSHVIALSGISCALALICVVCSIFVEFMTLTFAVLSAIAISLPFTKNYWAGGIIAYVACSICAFFIGNINSLPFIMFFGAYAIIQWSIEYKLYPKFKNKIVKYTVCYVIKLAYLEIVIAILWFFVNAVIPTLVIFGKEIKMTYLILSLGAIPIFILYDIMMHLLFKDLTILVSKIVKDGNSTTTTEDDYVEQQHIDVFEEMKNQNDLNANSFDSKDDFSDSCNSDNFENNNDTDDKTEK